MPLGKALRYRWAATLLDNSIGPLTEVSLVTKLEQSLSKMGIQKDLAAQKSLMLESYRLRLG
jgi:hypothetical protein